MRRDDGKSNLPSFKDSTNALNSFTNERKSRIQASSPSCGLAHTVSGQMACKILNIRRVIWTSPCLNTFRNWEANNFVGLLRVYNCCRFLALRLDEMANGKGPDLLAHSPSSQA
jgi:hypothetical protein